MWKVWVKVHWLTRIQLLNRRFTDFTKIRNYIQLFSDPFNLETVPEEYQSEVMSLRNNHTFVNAYQSSTVLEFYKQLSSDFPKLKQNAMRITSYFATTYRCEQLFLI